MEKSVHTAEYQVVIELLREQRIAAGITQVELAEMLQQTQSFVSKMECGDCRLDIIQLRTVCELLGTSLTAFVELLETRLNKSRKRQRPSSSSTRR
ncbi:MAG: helix-turn-helix transcriptional regulator [Fuerstiella sp.]|nr:helix-turn-helix transcriptional regulator [Fuerstiella sp.]MCP4787182.1 helix-turn-helix transcriptional regulator [Fuerstiella sp.]MCP4853412.1 helix-turn-helix transcriptional regulator [Fuerstiella sp.]